MSLTDVKIRNTKAKHKANQANRLAGGLYLEVRPTGAKLWRYRYRIAGKENVFAIGEYFNDKRTGHISLDSARGERDKARALVKQGIHPSHNRRNVRMAQHSENANTFRAVALEWIAKKHRDGRLTTYIKLSEGSMLMCSPESATYRSAV